MQKLAGKTAVVTGGNSGIGRVGMSEEIARGFLFLASDDSRYMVGSELLLDGGMRVK